jgi:lipoteichoic acid synthase
LRDLFKTIKFNRFSNIKLLRIIFAVFFILSLIIKCAYFQFSTKLNFGHLFTTTNATMLVASFSTILMILAIAIAISNRKRLLVIFIFNIILSAIIITDTLYFRYYYNAFTIPVFYQIGLVSTLTDSIIGLLKFADLIFLFDIPFYVLGFIIQRNLLKNGSPIYKISIVKKIVAFIAVFLIGLTLTIFTYNATPNKAFAFDNNNIITNMGIFYFHYVDSKKFITDNYFTDKNLTKSDIETITNYFNSKKTSGEKYKGIAKGKNLIVVQVEALQQFVINRELYGQEITPNLNNFINKSAYFDNFYYQIGGGNTSDAEFLANTSLYPLKDGAVNFRYPANYYQSTAKQLKRQGYNTYAFHANTGSFWNRSTMFKSLGFDYFFTNKQFSLDDEIGWGLTDNSFFRQSLEKIDMSKPFYSFLITLSSHFPYNYFDDYKGIDVRNHDGTFFGDYIKSMKYADQAIGSLFEDLKKRGLFENSVIVIYGDHFGIPKNKSKELLEMLNINFNEFDWTMLQKTPCFISFPGLVDFGKHETICGEIDILPTVANLMGFDVPYAMGKDLFNTKESFAILRNSSVLTNDFSYINCDKIVYDRNGSKLKKSDYNIQIAKYLEQLRISDIIITKNALKTIIKR